MTLLMMLLACGAKDAADTAEVDASFTAVRDEVLLPSCAFSSCHGAGAGGLTLDEAGAYDALVDVASVSVDGEILVIPGDPDGSYLMKKIEETADIVGDPMPPDAPLDADRQAQVRAWIADGAAND